MFAPLFVLEQDISATEANRQNACSSTSGCFYIAARSAYNSSDSASVNEEAESDDAFCNHGLLSLDTTHYDRNKSVQF